MLEGAQIWIVTDGKMGDLVQCRGVAAALGGPIREIVVKPSKYWAWMSPRGPIPPKDQPNRKDSPIAGPFPDIVIASGRRTVPYLRAIKRAHPGVFNVFLKHPRYLDPAIDLIWCPRHDNLTGPNVIVTDTGPHPFSADKLAAARASGHLRFADRGTDLTGIILGGNSGGVTFDQAEATRAAHAISAAVPDPAKCLIVPSRRTPPTLSDAIKAALPSAWFWTGEGENPYLQVLTASNRLFVTGDSHNMVSEATAMGTPVYVFRPKGLPKKLHAFLDSLELQNMAQPLLMPLPSFAVVPSDPTTYIAQQIAYTFEKSRPNMPCNEK